MQNHVMTLIPAPQNQNSLRIAYFTLFVLSGFSGLIYESIWSHYLKLFLGHAAYAQTLVLVIFMGGMALGAELAGRFANRLKNPLMVYAAAELVIGFFGLIFHRSFEVGTGWVFDVAIPALETPLLVDALKWSLGALLILPQCVLLGATFPLMTSGVLRAFPQNRGEGISTLYFTNSLGASAGVLISGFVLIGQVGLPGTIMTASLINIFLAVSVWGLARRTDVPPRQVPVPADGGSFDGPHYNLLAWMLGIAFFTGMASFMYEIAWIRMLSLVLGSATHSFELMLSAFILGLALGSYWMRGRIDRLKSPVETLGWVQVAMGVLAISTLLSYGRSFDLMAWVLDALQRNVSGYLFFNLASHAICLVIMVPVTFCAGMTLPLITHVLLRSSHGERSIGQVYAANTAGSIVGVLLAVHLVMPTFGLKQVIVLGGAVDLLLGFVLLLGLARLRQLPAMAGVAAAVLAAVSLSFVGKLEVQKLASGVYRSGAARVTGEVTFHRDGKSASVDLIRTPDGTTLAIATNGKTDAMLRTQAPASPDDSTMILASVLPLLLKPDAKDVAVIGFGSGRSTHVYLGYPPLRRVDTIEIEPAMVEAARLFGPLVSRAYEDPRSHIHIEDAKSYFSRHNRRYDIIMSEPSNPWVSGVAGLFTKEFYRRVKRHLTPGGLFVQWLQLYEIDEALVASVLQAIGSEFGTYSVYAANGADLLIIAKEHGSLAPPDPAVLEVPELQSLLASVGILSMGDIHLLHQGDRMILEPLVLSYGQPPNSDYFPLLDLGAARTRYLQVNAVSLAALHPVTAALQRQRPSAEKRGPLPEYPVGNRAYQAQRVEDYFRWVSGVGTEPGEMPNGSVMSLVTRVRAARNICDDAAADSWREEFALFIGDFAPFLSVRGADAVVRDLQKSSCGRPMPTVNAWLRLLTAIVHRNDSEVSELADALADELAGKNNARNSVRSWAVLLLEGMLADLRRGDGQRALARFLASPKLKADPALGLLVAHAELLVAARNQAQQD